MLKGFKYKLRCIMFIIGFIIIGYWVLDMIWKGIIDVEFYNGIESILMVGNVVVLIGKLIVLFLLLGYLFYYFFIFKNFK